MPPKNLFCCAHCDYTSDRSYNLHRHSVLKHNIELTEVPHRVQLQHPPVQLQHAEVQLQHAEVQLQHAPVQLQHAEVQLQHSQEPISPLRCEHCMKLLSSNRNLQKHVAICSNKKLEYNCDICHRKFSAKSSLSIHKKTCKIANTVPSNTTIVNGNLTNNIHIENNNTIHIHINNFGQESMDHITPEFAIQCFEREGGMGLLPMINSIFFHPDHPENHNAYLHSVRDSIAKIRKNDQWVQQTLYTVMDEIIQKARMQILRNIKFSTLDSYSDDSLCQFQNRMRPLQGDIDPSTKRKIAEKTKSKLMEQKLVIMQRLTGNETQ